MSLIVATSRLNENTDPIDSERPANFTNFFRSPIEIPPNSEIAVESVKIERTGNVTVSNRDFFTHYFGTDPDDLPEDDTFDNLLSLSRTIKVERGTYNMKQYAQEVQNALNNQYAHPNIFGGHQVTIHTNASGQELGLDMKYIDKGPATVDVSGSLAGRSVFNIRQPWQYYENGSVSPSNKFTWTVGTGVFAHVGAAASTLVNSSCVGILTGRPFGLNNGEFILKDLQNASAQPWICGLSRPQIQWETYESESGERDNINNIDAETAPYADHDLYPLNSDGTDVSDHETGYEIFDFAVSQTETDKIAVYHRVYDPDSETQKHQEIAYWTATGGSVTANPGTQLTKSQFYASYDGFKMVGKGDNIQLFFKQKGKTVFDQIIGENLDTATNRCFVPISDTSYALYPMLHLGDGSVTVDNFDSNYTGITPSPNYLYPSYTTGAKGGYKAGSDMFSNEAVYADLETESGRVQVPNNRQLASSDAEEAISIIDNSLRKHRHPDATPRVFVGLNSANGVDFKHLLTVGKISYDNSYFTILSSQEFPNMSAKLGFEDYGDVASTSGEGYVSGDDTLTVTFTSTGELLKTGLSSFIRLPSMTHKSFNGGQSGLSKIVYQVPQFSNDGRQFGPLFFSPGEKTYLSLNNPGPILLNSLQVQIVDSQEKELNSLTGTTQVVFHVRKQR